MVFLWSMFVVIIVVICCTSSIYYHFCFLDVSITPITIYCMYVSGLLDIARRTYNEIIGDITGE